MALLALTSERVEIAGVDRSSFFKAAMITIDVAEKEVTNYVSAGWKEVVGGIKSSQFTGTVNDDFAAAAIDSVVFPILGTVVTLKLRPTNAATSASNPEYQTSVMVKNTSAGGKVGDVAEKSFTWPVTGPVVRAVV